MNFTNTEKNSSVLPLVSASSTATRNRLKSLTRQQLNPYGRRLLKWSDSAPKPLNGAAIRGAKIRLRPGLADPHERKVRSDKGTGRRKPKARPAPRLVARHGTRHIVEVRHKGKPALLYLAGTELQSFGLR